MGGSSEDRGEGISWWAKGFGFAILAGIGFLGDEGGEWVLG